MIYERVQKIILNRFDTRLSCELLFKILIFLILCLCIIFFLNKNIFLLIFNIFLINNNFYLFFSLKNNNFNYIKMKIISLLILFLSIIHINCRCRRDDFMAKGACSQTGLGCKELEETIKKNQSISQDGNETIYSDEYIAAKKDLNFFIKCFNDIGITGNGDFSNSEFSK